MDEIARCYQVLGLEVGASHEEVKRAYRDLVKVWHPDRFAHDPRLQLVAQEKLKEINGVYKILESSFFENSIAPDPVETAAPDSPPGEQESVAADPAPSQPRSNRTVPIVCAAIVLIFVLGAAPFVWKFYQARQKASAQQPDPKASAGVKADLKDVELILWDGSAAYIGKWTEVSPGKNKKGRQFRYAGTVDGVPTAVATFTPNIPGTGNYDVYIWYTEGGNRSSSAPFEIIYDGGTNRVSVDETGKGGRWEKVAAGTRFRQGTNGCIRLTNNTGETNHIVAIHGVRFVASANQ